jgi:MinD superfamily P-loop ATPase
VIISVASGKGGTGKTTIAVNMALSLEQAQLLDCDVEEPNAHLLLQPETVETIPFYTTIPTISKDRYDYCRVCAQFCAYNALFVAPETIMVFPELCHSCGGCMLVCPRGAIEETPRKIGNVNRGTTRGIDLVYGELDVGKPMPVPIIRAVKAQIQDVKPVVIDAPPGTACSLVTAIYRSDYCILVAEPTPFGLHDLQITVQVLKAMRIPIGVVINRAGIGDRKIYDYCAKEALPLLLEIPFSKRIAELYSRGIPFVTVLPEWTAMFRQLYDEIERRIEQCTR